MPEVATVVGDGKPATLSVLAAAEFTVMPDSVPVILEVALSVEREIWKLLSLVELSCQVSVIWLVSWAAAVRLVGAAGVGAGEGLPCEVEPVVREEEVRLAEATKESELAVEEVEAAADDT